MLENLDKYAVLDDIIPLMNQIPSREPPTLMAILGKHIHPCGDPRYSVPHPWKRFLWQNAVVDFTFHSGLPLLEGKGKRFTVFDTYKFTKTVDKTLFWQPKPIYYLK